MFTRDVYSEYFLPLCICICYLYICKKYFLTITGKMDMDRVE
jgi:hypothetical protein